MAETTLKTHESCPVAIKRSRHPVFGSRAIRLDAAMLVQLRRHARLAYPEECCGLLIGRGTGREARVERLIDCVNLAEGDKTRRYQIDPKTLLAAVKSSREGGGQILGFYHSHPDGTSEPSTRDRAEAWVDHSYLIVPILDGHASEPTSWRIVDPDRGFLPERLLIG